MLYTKEQFNIKEAQEVLSKLLGKFTFPKDGDITKVNNIIEEVMFAMEIHESAPKVALRRALYPKSNEDNSLKQAHFVVRPTVNYALSIDAQRYEFTLLPDEKFFDKFIKEFIYWFDNWAYYKKLQTNLDALNEVVSNLITENNIPFIIRFGVGNNLLDATDDFALIGLSEETIQTLTELPLFDGGFENRKENYMQQIVDILKTAVKPYHLVKVKTRLTKRDLDIYSRRGVNHLIREFVSRNLAFVRTGIGYYEDKNVFAVVNRVAVTKEELENLDTSDALVTPNANPTVKEKNANQEFIYSSYRIAPFNKKTLEPVELSLEEAIKGGTLESDEEVLDPETDAVEQAAAN